MTDSSFTEGRLPSGSDVVKGFLVPARPAIATVGKPTEAYAKTIGFHVHSNESIGFEGLASESFKATNLRDAKQMDDKMTKDELNAHLAKNKAEVESVASSMRADMAQWRELNNTQMSALQAQLSSLNSKIDGKFEGMEGKIDGLKTTSSTVQWMVGAILALLAVLLAYPPIQKYLDTSNVQKVEQPKQPAQTEAAPSKPN